MLVYDLYDFYIAPTYLNTPFFVRIPNFLRASIFSNFSDLEPRIIFILFLNTKGITLPTNLRKIFQSLLMLCIIMKLSKSLCFVLIMQKYT